MARQLQLAPLTSGALGKPFEADAEVARVQGPSWGVLPGVAVRFVSELGASRGSLEALLARAEAAA